MSNKYTKVYKFIETFEKSDVFKSLHYDVVKIDNYIIKHFLYNNKFMNFNFDNFFESMLGYEFYSIYYQSVSNPKKLIEWITDSFKNQGLKVFSNNCINILNNTKNHNRFRDYIDNNTPLLIEDTENKSEFNILATKYKLDRTELLILILLSDYEYFSIHDFKLEKLTIFYNYLVLNYNFEINDFLILLSIINFNDKEINTITHYINNFTSVAK